MGLVFLRCDYWMGIVDSTTKLWELETVESLKTLWTDGHDAGMNPLNHAGQ
jgi:hypothetical protein